MSLNKNYCLIYASVCLCRDMKHAGSLERMKEVLELPEVDLRATLAS